MASSTKPKDTTPLLDAGNRPDPQTVEVVNEFSKTKKYLTYVGFAILIAVFIEGLINYHKIMDRFQAYLTWVRALLSHKNLIIGLNLSRKTIWTDNILLILRWRHHLLYPSDHTSRGPGLYHAPGIFAYLE